MVIVSIILVLTVLPIAACLILAYLYDYEAAGLTGCMKKGQVW